ncbi:MAG: phosphoglycerate dehydrogenase [Planctomycetes bacterium]|nr:phosphoglycerate dehydrogenase [Planctomycetota bacterium]
MNRILIADRLDPAILASLAEEGVEIVDRAGITADDLLREIVDYEALIVRSRTKVTDELLAAGRRLRVVGRAGTGVDNIDVAAATRRGVLVMNTPGANSNSAAEHAVAMMLALYRRIPRADQALRGGEFKPAAFTGREVAGKVLGLVGLGRIGRLVAEKARGLGMTVVGYDPVATASVAAAAGIELLDLPGLYRRADVVSLHVPLMESTRHMIDAAALAAMKPGVALINCARGGLIDEAALQAALESGQVSGAALDVFEVEPPFESPLLRDERVVVTPHLGASTLEAQEIVARNVLAQTTDYLLGRGLRGAVNGLEIDESTRGQIEPYLELAERLGRIVAGLEGRSSRLSARYYGTTTSRNVRALTAHFLKGYLAPFLGPDVNVLNARERAAELGLEIEETTRDSHRSFRSLLYFVLDGGAGDRAIAGTTFGRHNLRVVRLGGHNIDSVPEGHMLIVHNQDRPGVLGQIAGALGSAGVNVGNMSLGRRERGGEALAVFNLDDKPSGSLLAALRSIEGVVSVAHVDAEPRS